MNAKKLNKNYLYFSILLLGSSLLVCLHIITYVDLDQPIYSWDYKGYFRSWQYLSQLQEYSTSAWFEYTLHSVRTSDYSVLPIAFLFPFYYLPLNNRTAYILAISICYFIPVILFLTFLFKRIFDCNSYLWLSYIFILSLTFPPFWAPLLRGYPDIVGLIPIILVIIFTLESDLSHRISIKNILILGFLLWLPFALRRWYAYTVVSLYLTLPFFSFFIHTKKDKLCFNKYYRIGIHFLLAGIISLLLSFLFQKEILLRDLNTDYSNIYSAYQYGLLSSLLETIKFFGLYLLPLFTTGLISSLFLKKSFIVINALFFITIFSFTFYDIGSYKSSKSSDYPGFFSGYRNYFSQLKTTLCI